MRMNSLDLATANAFVRFHFDKFRDPILKVQAHNNVDKPFHYDKIYSLEKGYQRLGGVPLRLIDQKRHFSRG